MKELFRLPFDSSGFGDFGVVYLDTDAKIRFEYNDRGRNLVGEIYFSFCTYLLINGRLDKQKELPYDTVFIDREGIGCDGSFNSYLLMLSGSDFQFEAIAKSCTFRDSVDSLS